LDNGVIKGWKKILVLHKCYNEKKVKTNWTMHQCHLGAEVGEKHGELVVSRVFWQVKNNTRKSKMHAADAESGSSAVEINPTTPNMYPPQPRGLSGSPLETEQNQVIINSSSLPFVLLRCHQPQDRFTYCICCNCVG
jgi:hypothetical protein